MSSEQPRPQSTSTAAGVDSTERDIKRPRLDDAPAREEFRRAPTWRALNRSSAPRITPSRSIYSYERLNHIQEGTYGVVFRARPRANPPSPSHDNLYPPSDVAVKKLKLDRDSLHEGFPITSLREIQALTLARNHPSVVKLEEVCIGKTLDQIFLVMEFVEHDLKTLLTSFHRRKSGFTPSEVKTLMHQLLSATAKLHDEWILHRDLKTSNLLMNNQGRLKVADFGLARRFGDPIEGWKPDHKPRENGQREEEGGMTDLVCTLWYRAPELLLLNARYKEREAQIARGSYKTKTDAILPPLYDEKIDMWSIGCIFAELLLTTSTGQALFQGRNEADQWKRISDVLGDPEGNKILWPDYWSYFSDYSGPVTWPSPYQEEADREREKVIKRLARHLKPVKLTEGALDLLARLLAYDPKQRISAKEALQHEYFQEPPRMAHPDSFGSFPSVAAGERVPKNTPSPPKQQRRRREGDGEGGKDKDYPLEFDFSL